MSEENAKTRRIARIEMRLYSPEDEHLWTVEKITEPPVTLIAGESFKFTCTLDIKP